MSANSLKSRIIKNVAHVDDVQLLKQINALLVKSKKEIFLNVPKKQKEEITLARKQIESGNYSTHDSIENKFTTE